MPEIQKIVKIADYTLSSRKYLSVHNYAKVYNYDACLLTGYCLLAFPKTLLGKDSENSETLTI